MNAPTAPTAPLPSELQDAIERTDDMAPYSGYDPDEQGQIALFRHLYESDWQLIRESLLTMLRGRDEALSTLDGVSSVQRRALHDLGIARKQLAASERTCAELRASIDRAVTGMNALSVRLVQIVDDNAMLRTRAEAAERTVQFLSQAHKEFWEENSSDTLYALGPTAVFNSIKSRAAELARLEGGK